MNLQDAVWARRSGGTVVIAPGLYDLTHPIEVRDDVAVVAAGQGDVILNLCTPGMAAFTYAATTAGRCGVSFENLIVQSLVPETTGVHLVNAGCVTVRSCRFRGIARNVHLDRGMGHSLLNLRSESWGPNPSGVLLLEAPEGDYIRHVTIADYYSDRQTFSSPIIMHRAANVTASNLHIFACGLDAILIDDDSQGIIIADSELVGCANGVLTANRNGQHPLLVTLRNVDVDQHTGVAYMFSAGYRLRAQGGAISYGWQGVYIGPETQCGAVRLRSLEIFGCHANGVVAASNASNWSVDGCSIEDNGGAGVVISTGVSNSWRVRQNDFFRNATGNFVNQSTGSGIYVPGID